MRLLRYGPKGAEKPGLLDGQGRIRDLSREVPDINGAALAPENLARLAARNPESLPLVEGTPRVGAPVAHVPNLICIGLNYADHAAETGAEPPVEPVLFSKAVSALAGPNDDLPLPRGSEKTDWEVELGVVIGRTASYVADTDALDHVAGYCVCNDYSERAWQLEGTGTWDKGKGCDGYGPIGPWLVTRDEAGDPQNLSMWLEVNGRRMQDGATRTMIFGVAELVSYVSRFMSLHPGDVISTGTPPGVGMGRKPPQFLRPGDVVELGIEGLGRQRQVIKPSL
jgi:2-keto-4-pentenoate hydratase/2-oxohepta-3-ene-1,7-dioic acid hydratase in catechol pathway